MEWQGIFCLESPVARRIVSAAYSGQLGIWKTETAVEIVDETGKLIERAPAPQGPAIVGFSTDGASCAIYYPSSQALVRWRDGSLDPLSFDEASLAGDVVAVAISERGDAILLAGRHDGFWLVQLSVRRRAASVIATLPGVHAPALVAGDGRVVYRDEAGLAIRSLDQTEVHITLDSPDALSWLGAGWVQARSGSRNFAVRVIAGRESAYGLPEAAR